VVGGGGGGGGWEGWGSRGATLLCHANNEMDHCYRVFVHSYVRIVWELPLQNEPKPKPTISQIQHEIK